jgi:hypothetical protein
MADCASWSANGARVSSSSVIVAPDTTCAYCRATVPVPREIREPAIAYAARMGAVQGRAAETEKALGVYRVSAAYQKDWWKIVAGMFGTLIAYAVLGSILGPYVDKGVLSGVAMAGVYGTMGYFGYRYYRQMYRRSAGMARFTRVYVLAGMAGPVVLLVGIFLVVGVARLLSAAVDGSFAEPRQGLVLLVVGGVLGSLAAAAAIAIHAKVIVPARAAAAALRAIAARRGGRVVEGGTTAAIDWLDAHWWGLAPYELMMGQQEIARTTLETAVAGLPALVVAVATGPMRFSGKRLHVLVAAPAARDGSGAQAVWAELARRGFEVKVSEDGVALARDEAGPEVMSEAVLGWILTEAAALARAR